MSDAAIAAKQCDGAILVIESEAVSRRDAMKAKEQLTKSGCKILGAVLNKVDMKKEKYYSKYSSYYYGKSKQEQLDMQWRISAAYSILQRKTDKAFKINEIRCFVMQSDRRLSGEKGVRECIERTVTAG